MTLTLICGSAYTRNGGTLGTPSVFRSFPTIWVTETSSRWRDRETEGIDVQKRCGELVGPEVGGARWRCWRGWDGINISMLARASRRLAVYGDILVAFLIPTWSRTSLAVITALMTLQRGQVVASRRDFAKPSRSWSVSEHACGLLCWKG